MSNYPLLVLAGGLGTRLSKVVVGPKALAPIQDIPFLHYQIINWKGEGIRSFVFLVYYKADLIRDFIQREKNVGILSDCAVRIVEELEPLGTGGAVVNAVQSLNIKHPFFITNADTWIEGAISKLLNTERQFSIASITIQDVSRYGTLEVTGDRVTGFLEKTNRAEKGLINGGVYFCNCDIFELLKKSPFSIENDLFPEMVKSGSLFHAEVDGNFIDIGVPEDYNKFCLWIKSNKNDKL